MRRSAPPPAPAARRSLPPLVRRASVIAAASSLVVALVACGDDAPPPPRDPFPSTEPSPPSGAPDPIASTSGGEPAAPGAGASGGAEADAGADAGADGGLLAQVAGVWEGAYEAKKGFVTMPSDVPDPARASDDGKVASGPGTVTLTIGPSGEVKGRSQGALGAATIRGQLDGKMLRTSFVPDAPTSPHAMTGVLVGIVKPDAIKVELRVAGPDALLVRQANFDLKKKEQP